MVELPMTPPTPSVTRAGLLRQGACAAGIALVGVPALVGAAASPEQDERVLNLLLLVEHTESAFYREALAGDGLTGELRSFAEQVLEHEEAHLGLLKSVLGSAAVPEPEHDFGESTRDRDAFADTAARLEDLAVAAYNGQAANVSPEAFAAAARIVSVEARHAAWIRSIVGRDPAPQTTDEPMTEAQVRSALGKLGVQL
jgi:rubrerythrin